MLLEIVHRAAPCRNAPVTFTLERIFMRFEYLLPLLAKPASDHGLRLGLAAQGFDLDDLELPEGEFRAYLEAPEIGFALVFTDEAYFLGEMDRPAGIGELFFSGLFLYVEAVEEYAPYQAALPFGLLRGDTHFEAHAKLGASEWSRIRDDGSLWEERWTMAAKRTLHLTYASSGNIALLSYQVPDAL